MENNETALQVIDNITLLNNHFMNKVLTIIFLGHKEYWELFLKMIKL